MSAHQAEAAHLRANTLTRETLAARRRDAMAPSAAPPLAPVQAFSRTDAAAFHAALDARTGAPTGARGVAIAISHDHHLSVTGGLQNCIGLEADAFARRDWLHLHLCPARPGRTLADPHEAAAVLVSLDGRTLGILAMADLAEVLAAASLPGPRWVILHQLLGHAPERVQALIEALGAEAYFWTHDLFAHCPSVHLLRNDAVFCGGPPVGAAPCSLCHAGAERAAHVARMDVFFTAVRPIVLAPSATMLDCWRGLHKFAHDAAHVVPPCALHPDTGAAPLRDGPLRVAFLGGAVFHKGFDVFDALAQRYTGDARYAFFRLGFPGEKVPGIAEIPVTVTAADRMAMARAVRTHAIDAVVNWSRCHESFSFTAIEALAGGAFLIAREAAGNVAPLLHATRSGRGIALAAPVELEALFETGDIVGLARAARPNFGTLAMGEGAASLLPPPG